ncbi:ABC-type multidrug transport system fused ATPase/permease subunit [Providencia alcalifaciens]|nr:ABC-type multidrug transport system fused ATPase/permease subunit [Providencia alcalifaciens]
MSQMLALFIIVFILYIGDAIAVRTKAWIPSVFVCAVLFLLGYWTFFPKNIVSIAGIPQVVAITLMYLLITNMGTLLSLKELMRQWKTIVISLSGILGIIVFTFIVGITLFDMNTVLVAIPPLVGGIVSSLIMSKGAADAGLIDLAVFAIVIYVMQGFAGYPLTAIMLKREGRRVLEKYRNGQWKESLSVEDDTGVDIKTTSSSEDAMPRLFKKIPSHYNTAYFKFLRLAAIGYLAYLVSSWTAPIISISPFVLCLLFGVVASSLGFLERQPLQKANGFGFAIMALMLFIFDTLNHATPDMLMRLVYPLVVLIVAAVIGMYLASWIVGKILGVSKEMAFAVSLTALYGFPADYIITNEAINALTKDEKEREVLTGHMLGPMLVGGFISVTIVSVVLAGIMVSFITPFAG